jgi:hypothetical protein
LHFCVFENALDLVVLHLILDGAYRGTLCAAVAYLEGLRTLRHRFKHLGIDTLVDVDPLGSSADLAGVEEGAEDNLRRGFLDINIGAYDGCVVPSTAGRLAIGSLSSQRYHTAQG